LTREGKVYVWGGNNENQVGDDTTANRYLPKLVQSNLWTDPNLNPNAPLYITAIAAGDSHTMVLAHDGTVWTWGLSTNGQIGDADNSYHRQGVPAQIITGAVPGGASQFAVDIATGLYNSYVVMSDGLAYGFGVNDYGQLGTGTGTLTSSALGVGAGSPSTAFIIPGSLGITRVFGGPLTQTVVLQANSTMYFGAGRNTWGVFGIGTSTIVNALPVRVNLPFPTTTYPVISYGDQHGLYVTSGVTCFSVFAEDVNACTGHGKCTTSDTCVCNSGYVSKDCSLPTCFGLNATDSLVCSGNGLCLTIDTCACYPGFDGVQCSNDTSGLLFASGEDVLGQLGDSSVGADYQELTPINPSSTQGEKILMVAVGDRFSILLRSNNTVWSTGYNLYNQLGDGTGSNQPVPVPVLGIPGSAKIEQICAGQYNAAALDSTGRVYIWGYNVNANLGQGNTVASTIAKIVNGVLTNEVVVQISCGNQHTVVLTRNGTVFTWGFNNYGQVGDGSAATRSSPVQIYMDVFLYKRRVSQVCAGYQHTLALVDDGTIYGWGDNQYYELGATAPTYSYTPIPLVGTAFGLLNGKKFVQISCSNSLTSFALDANGTVYSWGYGASGQVGNGVGTANNLPQRILSSVKVSALFTGSNTAAALTNTSLLYIWGRNANGEIGDNTLTNALSPKLYNINYPNRAVQSVAIGYAGTFVLYDTNRACYGFVSDDPYVCSHHGACIAADTCVCDSGYSGNNCEIFSCNSVLSTNSSACAGNGHCMKSNFCFCYPGWSGANCDVRSYGYAFTSGLGSSAQLGDGFTNTYFSFIRPAGWYALQYINTVCAGYQYSLTLTVTGQVHSFGDNSYGQLGTGDTSQQVIPYPVKGGLTNKNIVAVSAGYFHSLAVDSNGTLYSWGSQSESGFPLDYGWLGQSTTTTSLYTPTAISNLGLPTDFVAVSAARRHSMALTRSGLIYTWGSNQHGQIGDNTYTNRLIPTRVVSTTLVNRFAVSIAVGQNFSMALTHDGMVITWGDGDYGQMGDNYAVLHMKPSPRFVQSALAGKINVGIGAGPNTAYSVTESGRVYAWGGNLVGERGDVSTGSVSKAWIPAAITIQPTTLFATGIVTSMVSKTVYLVTNVTGGFANITYYGFGDNSYGKFAVGTNTTVPTTLTKISAPFNTTTFNSIAFSDQAVYASFGYTCYGIFSEDPLVCSGKGVCASSDNCVCLPGYYDVDCGVPTCYGINATDPTVCGGNGHCLTIDTCVCFRGYSDPQCGTIYTGTVYGSGSAIYGELGDGVGTGYDYIPVPSKLFKGISALAVAVGSSFTLVLSNNGTIYGVGLNTYGQLGDGTVVSKITARTKVGGLLNGKTVVDFCAGWGHTLAVDSNGALYAWGYNGFGQLGNGGTTNTPNPQLVQGDLTNMTVVQVACGMYHSTVLTRNGTVFVFGRGDSFQIGDGYAINRYLPVHIYMLGVIYKKRVVQVAAGSSHTVALGAEGIVFTWGSNANGQLGDGTLNTAKIPTIAKGALTGNKIVRVTTGGSATHALNSNGTLYGWGVNTYGQIGNGAFPGDSGVPTKILSNMWRMFTGGGDDSTSVCFALNSNRNLLAWGYGGTGTLGNGLASSTAAPAPYNIYFPNRTVIDAVAFPDHSIVLYSDNLTCYGILPDEPSVCGFNGNCVAQDTCSCDSGYTGTECNIYTCFGLNSTDSQVCSGEGTCIATDICVCYTGISGAMCDTTVYGALYGFGYNVIYYALGDDDLLNTRIPVKTVGFLFDKLVTQVRTGQDHTTALSLDGTFYVWGSNVAGQLYYNAAGSNTARPRPYANTLTANYDSIFSGRFFSYAINTTSGDMYAWGNMNNGAGCGSPYCINGAGGQGPNAFGNWVAVQPPSKVTGMPTNQIVRKVACGAIHVMLLTYNGTLFGLGYNVNGELGIGSVSGGGYPNYQVFTPTKAIGLLATNFIADVACGDNHCLAIDSRGQLYSWGYNGYGQLGDGTASSKSNAIMIIGPLYRKTVVAIAAAFYSSYAITSDGNVYAWGRNTIGQLGIGSTVTQFLPVRVNITSNVSVVALMAAPGIDGHVLALTSSGTVYGWGLNTYGQVGDNTVITRTNPVLMTVPIPAGSTIVALSAGPTHTMIIVNGTFCYGILASHPLVCSWRGTCIGTDTCSCTSGYSGNKCELSTCFGVLSTVNTTCSGHGACVDTDTCVCDNGYTGSNCSTLVSGYTYVLGDNSFYQLGDDTVASVRSNRVTTAYPLSTGTFINQVVTGYDNTFIITTSNDLYTWGSNRFNTLGLGLDPTTYTYWKIPRQVSPGTKFISVSSNLYHTAAVDSQGRLWTWGWNFGAPPPSNYIYQCTQTLAYSPWSQTVTCTQTSCPCDTPPTKTGQMGTADVYFFSFSPVLVAAQSAGQPYVQVSAGLYHTIALSASGQVYSFGRNYEGQLGDGSVNVAGGLNLYLLTPVLTGSTAEFGGWMYNRKAVSVQAGDYYSLVLLDRGDVYSFGSNSVGQLGDGTTVGRAHPRFVSGTVKGKTAVSLGAGTQISYAVLSDGTAASWGYTTNGALGLNKTSGYVMNPTNILGVSTAVSVTASVSTFSAMILTSSGDTYGMGLNTQYLLGDTTTTQRNMATKSYNDFTTRVAAQVAPSYRHTAFLMTGMTCFNILSDDPAACGFRGQCTAPDTCTCITGYTGVNCTTPICFGVVATNSSTCSGNGFCTQKDWCQCFPGYSGTQCADAYADYLFGAGTNANSELGDGTNFATRYIPAQSYQFVKKPYHFVTSGNQFSIAINVATGLTVGWGINSRGQLALGYITSVIYPTKTLAGLSFAVIMSCEGHSISLDKSGVVRVWGANANYQIGTGTTADRLTPYTPAFPPNETFVDVACSSYHSMAVSATGVVYTWGYNNNGQLGRSTDNTIPGRIADALILKKAVRVAAGDYHSTVLCDDGTLYGVGSNLHGQLADGTTNTRTTVYNGAANIRGLQIASINANGVYSMHALLSNNTLYSWGDNTAGYLGDGTLTDRLLPVQITTPYPIANLYVGYSFAFVTNNVNSNISVHAWGLNTYGQLGDGTTTNRAAPTNISNTYSLRYVASVAPGRTHTIFSYRTTACFGYLFDDPLVCNQRGTCTAQDTCQCIPSYYGNDCSIKTCFGINSTDPTVCSGSGTCISLDTCVCKPGYRGDYCQASASGYVFVSGDDNYSQLGNKNIGTQPGYIQALLLQGKKVDFISTGFKYTIFKMSDNTLLGLGLNQYGVLGNNTISTTTTINMPIDIFNGKFNRNITSICANFQHAMLLDDNGYVYTWGYNTYGQLGIGTFAHSYFPIRITGGALGNDTISAISCGYSFSVAVSATTGAVYTWGNNANGNLGDGTLTTRVLPVVVGGLFTDPTIIIIAAAAGGNHVITLANDGQVYTWGYNNFGQVGDASGGTRTLPVRIRAALAGVTVKSVSAGYDYTVALSNDGKVYTWGNNPRGQLGDGTIVAKYTPTKITIADNITSISAGGAYVMALSSSTGFSYAWGDNQKGQIGNGATSSSVVSSATKVPKIYTLANVTSIFAGTDTNYQSSYQIWDAVTCFGKFIEDPSSCSFGKGICVDYDTCQCLSYYNGPDCSSFNCFNKNLTDSTTCSGKGTCVAADSCICYPGYKGLDCSDVTTGFVYSLGDGSSGQIGDGYTFQPIVPSAVGGLLSGRVVSSIAAGLDFTIAIMNGKAYSWGVNSNGQLGDGTVITRYSPVAVSGLASTTITYVEAGTSHVAAIDNTGQVWTWGYNYRGQLGNSDNSYATKLNAAVVSALSSVFAISVSCGDQFTAVLTSDGAVYAFGENAQGELGDGTNYAKNYPVQSGIGTMDSVYIAAISAGYTHMLAIGPFGVVYAWGDNAYGQIGDGSTAPKYSPVTCQDPLVLGKIVLAIAASYLNSYAIVSDGHIVSWGGNQQGQLGINSTFQYQASLTYTWTSLVSSPKVLAAGKDSAFAMNLTGNAQSWGYDDIGQLGDNLAGSQRIYPVRVVNNYPGRTISFISPGSRHTAFLYNATACFGFLADDSNACSSRGSCVTTDTCVCNVGFLGSDCSVVQCNGVSSSDPMVCYGHGFCMPNDTCICDDMWAGRYCDVQNFGYLFATGQNQVGQLGIGDSIDRQLVTKGKATGVNMVPVKQMVGGLSFTLFVGTNERVYGLGLNDQSQLGDATTNNAASTPTALTLIPKNRNATIKSISAGTAFAAIVLSDNTVWTWGSNSYGQLGLGSTTTMSTATQVTDLTGYSTIQVSCALGHCLVLMKDGTVWSWGANEHAQLGDGTTTTAKTLRKPYKIMGILSIKKSVAVCAATYHSMALSSDGQIYSWGDNTYGQLGDNKTYTTFRLLPALVLGLSDMIVGITGGDSHSCALTVYGNVYCWGLNTYGQLGDGTYVSRLLPKAVIGLNNITIVKISSSRPGHNIALSSNGAVYTWGRNSNGQLGIYNSTITKNPTPKLVVTTTAYTVTTPRYGTAVGAADYGSYVLFNGTTCFNTLLDDPDVCTGNGTCVDMDTCTCAPGFSGYKCQFTSCFGLNATDPNACLGHGTCLYLDTCICMANKYLGSTCQFYSCNGLADNDANVCSGNGQCIGSNNCSCISTYTGNNCQYRICYGRNETDPLVCSGKGVCFTPNNCLCYNIPSPGYTGGNCSAAICTSRYFDKSSGATTLLKYPSLTTSLNVDLSNVCSGNGACTSPSTCTCKTGWTDTYCSTPICGGKNASDPLVCNSGKNGTCVGVNNCTCLTFYKNGNCVPLSCWGKNMTNGPLPCNQVLHQGYCVNVDTCNCSPGYGGNECDQFICNGRLQFNSSVCSGNGDCTAWNNCDCYSGYIGNDCQYIRCFKKIHTDVDVCSGNGACVAPDTCVCQAGYAGEKCENTFCYGVSSNVSSTCSGRGQCVAPNSCYCNSGYSGYNCAFASCFGVNASNSAVCSRHGSCIDIDVCNCTSDWTDRECNVPICFNVSALTVNVIGGINVCSGYGHCVGPNNCSCITSQRVGNQCEINVCFGLNATDPKVCNSAGTCVQPDRCSCTGGRTGWDCSTPTCFGTLSSDPTVCSAHGKCVITDTCMCNSDWSGTMCENPVCYGIASTDPTVCSGQGSCVAPKNCSCNDGFVDSHCITPVCFGKNSSDATVCSSQGACVAPDTCQCSTGYIGYDCSVPTCFGIIGNDSTVCTNSQGTCISKDLCNCTTGFTGTQCEISVCYGFSAMDPNVCSGNGTCTATDTCSCLPGKLGLLCELSVCYGVNSTDYTVCSGHGACTAPDHCTCNTGYIGDYCDIISCYGLNTLNASICNGQGRCTAPDHCVCNSYYTGVECLYPICYGKTSIDPTVCSGYGTCIAPDTCLCNNGHVDSECNVPLCFGTSATDYSVCSYSNGTCIATDTCNCTTGFTGIQCEIPICFGLKADRPKVCSGVGACVTKDKCVCNSGKMGTNCELNDCFGVASNDPNVCSGHGTCKVPGNCTCSKGYSGDTCSTIICYETDTLNSNGPVCSGHGTCVKPNTCVCDSDYTGTKCTLPLCYGKNSTDRAVCSGHGTCTGPDTCVCTTGYTGNNCSGIICYDSDTFNSNGPVCNGQGTCTKPNTCVCNRQYVGPKCTIPICYGKNSTNAAVCSSHGNCTAPDTCVCNAGYAGTNCSTIICYESDSLNSNGPVCSGRGTCVAPDTCVCKTSTKYYGPHCNITNCYGVPMDNSTVCSSIGNCTAPDTCICPEGYLGKTCEQYTCDGILSTDPTVCHGHGTCSNLNNCTCNPGYGGDNCMHLLEITLLSTIPSSATVGEIVQIVAKDLTLINCPLLCIFTYGDTVKNVTPTATDTTSITCVNPIVASHDERIYITARCEADPSTLNDTSLYFLYIDTIKQEAAQFNVSQLSCADVSDVPGSIGCPQNMTVLDQGSLLISSLFNSSAKGRRALRSLNPAPMLNQQAVVEFSIDTSTNALGNIVEAWISASNSFAVIALENDATRTLTMLLNITGHTGYTSSSCSFVYGTSYRIYLMFSPLRTSWAVTGQLLAMPSLRQVCMVQYDIPVSWNFDPTSFFKTKYSVVLSQSNILLKTYGIAARRAVIGEEAEQISVSEVAAEGRSIEAASEAAGDTMTVSLNRMAIECQPGYCGVTPTTTITPTTILTVTSPPVVGAPSISWSAYLLGALIALLLLLIIIAIIVGIAIAVHRRRKRSAKIYTVQESTETNSDTTSELDIPKDTVRVMDEEEEDAVFRLVYGFNE
jgi:alpha-tubulin suppressor-like RCC1 family protein